MRKFLRQNKRRGFTPTPFNKKGVSSDARSERGFTLVETLVALSIFSISILGLMTVLSSGIADTTVAKNKNTASYLAQEGVEYIRNLRDTYVLYDPVSPVDGWNDFITKLTNGECFTASGCYFDDQNVFYSDQSGPITDLVFINCVSGCAPILYDTLNSEYNYTTGFLSGFVRTIKITSISIDEVKVSSTVSFGKGSSVYSITFSENLFNWIE